MHLPDGRLSKTSYKNDDKFAKTKQMLCGTYSSCTGVSYIRYYEDVCRRWYRLNNIENFSRKTYITVEFVNHLLNMNKSHSTVSQ